MKKEAMAWAEKSIETEQQAVGDVLTHLDRGAFAKAVDALSGAKRIMTCASDSSGIAAKKLATPFAVLKRAPCLCRHARRCTAAWVR